MVVCVAFCAGLGCCGLEVGCIIFPFNGSPFGVDVPGGAVLDGLESKSIRLSAGARFVDVVGAFEVFAVVEVIIADCGCPAACC